MKWGSIQIIMAVVISTMTMAHTNYAQVLEKKITLNMQNASLREVLLQLKNESGIKFAFSESQINLDQIVSLNVENKPLREILDQLLTPIHVRWKLYENFAKINLLPENEPKQRSEIPSSDNEDSYTTISGKAIDSNTRLPMAGVNVIVKGSTNGTNTDADGNYTILAEGNDILIFSFIGYKAKEEKINARSVIDVSLEEDITSFSEVVVNAGYWKVTDKERTGNIGRVEAKDIEKQPVLNPLAALQARVPGVEITQQTGVPGGNFKVRIRGTNSISNGNDPLYIIDGVPFTSTSMSMYETASGILGVQGASPLNAINSSDIESIEVLKDGDATAIYGSRGANGVILITTKKGKQGKTKVDLNFYTGIGRVTNKLDLLNTRQYLDMRHEAFANDGITPDEANARDLVRWDTTRYTDWQKELIGGTAHTTDAQLSVSGGEANTQFLLGTGYHRETTVFPGDNSDQRISVHSNMTNTSFNRKLKTSLSVNYSLNTSNLLRQDLTSKALLLSPDAPALYDEEGKISWTGWTSSFENPVAFTKRIYTSTTNNLVGNAVIGYSILPSLEIRTNLGYTRMMMNAITTNPRSAQFPDSGSQSSSSFSNSNFQNWTIEPQLNWKPVTGKSKWDMLVGTTFLQQSSDGLSQTGYGYSSEALMKNLSSASLRVVGAEYYNQYRYQAAFARVNYNLNGRYIINLTARRDGSSRFGPGKQFANFGAAGAAWLFSEEEFIRSTFSFLSFGKLRASYGVTGNDQLTDYQYLNTYSSSSGSYQGTTGLQPDRLSNPDFAWETNKKLEAGMELGFVDDRIQTTFSFYRNRSSNQLVGYPLPGTTGFTTIQGNFPALVQNQGIEIELNTVNVKTPFITWRTSVNGSIPKNKLIAFPNLNAFPEFRNTYVVGEPLDVKKLYNYTGIDPQTGSYTFQDVNKDGSYNVNDRQTIRFVGQRFFGGIHNSIQVKSFQLDFLFQFVKQSAYNYIGLLYDAPGTLGNQPTWVLNHWRESGDNAQIQRYTTNSEALDAYYQLTTSQQAVSDASYIRLKNISLSCTLPRGWAEKLKLDNARVFIQGQNIITLTSYKGLDPETQYNSLPPLSVFTGGVHVTF